jgi:hypothetical protein
VLKAFLEPNVINWARRTGWSGADLRRALAARGYEPHFGVHGVYELARGLVEERNQADAQRNFTILSDLDPEFGSTPTMLFDKEVDKLRTGAMVIAVLDELNRASVRQQVMRMAAGHLETVGREFIGRREASIDQDYPRFTSQQLGQVRRAVAAGRPRPKTFEDVLAEFDDQVPGIIRQLLSNRVSVSEAAELHARLNEFPALRSTVRANLYLWAVPLIHDTGAARDKNDDYRHVIEASYCQALATGDGQLARTTSKLHPGLVIVTWSELGAG